MRTDSDSTQEILIALRKIIRAIDLHSKRLSQDHGVTGPQLVLLKELETGGELPAGELAKRVCLSQATVTNVLTRLEKRGLVSRARSTEDRRRVLVNLTDAGGGVLRAAPPLLQERFVRQLAELEDWEKTSLLASLQRVASMMAVSEMDAAPMLTTGPVSASVQETKTFLAKEPGNTQAKHKTDNAAAADSPSSLERRRGPARRRSRT